jgi:SAM-dependent methyltransferase
MDFQHPVRKRIRLLFNHLRYGRRLGPLIGRLQPMDDFDWSSYTDDSYRHQLRDRIEPLYTSTLTAADWYLEDGRVMIRHGKPLHPNHSVLYEAILKLKPNSIFEFGCGGGDHLANLGVLLPAARLGGADVSAAQLTFARERHDFGDDVRLLERDMTLRGATDDLRDSAEIVYTQAVLMHIHGRDRPEAFLRNMWTVSSRYLVLVENWSRHPYRRLFNWALPTCQPHYLARPGAVAVIFDKENALDQWPILESEIVLHRSR